MGMNPRTLRPSSTFTPRSISGLALWLDAADSSTLYTTDAGPVTAVSSPLDIAGCVGWWDASDASSITQSGGLVSQWNDKSGNGNHATASGSLRPTLTGNALNGMGVMTFGGSQGLTGTLATSIGTNAYSVFAVCRISGAITNGRVFSTGALGVADFAAGSVIPCLSNGGTLSAFSGTAGTNVSAVTGFASYGIFGGVLGSNLVANAANGLSNTSTSATLSATIARFGIGIAAQGGTGLNTADIAEIVYYSTALSPTDRARVEAYLAAKWGIANVHAPATSASQPVGYWADKSGNGRHATQGTAVRRPVIHSATQNNRRVLSFDGSVTAGEGDSLFGTGAQSLANGMTVIGAYFTGDVNFSSMFCVGDNAPGRRWVSGTGFTRITADYYTNSVLLAASAQNRTGVNSFTFDRTANAIGIRVDGAQAALQSSLSPALAAFTNNTFAVGTVPAANEQHMAGRMFELVVYNRVLSGADCRRIEQYLAAKWGITLAPQVSNADAQDWVNRVYANGGTVSAATAAAVNTFCNAIDAAGIRDRFYRLNLFAGNSDASLNAVRTPLYRGPSLTGTQYGNATDTNVNFVAGDYAENVGLTSGATSKHLRIGTLQSVFGGVPATGHMSARVGAWPGTARRLLGIFDLDMPAGQTQVMNYGLSFGQNGEASFGRTPLIVFTPLSQTATYLVNRSSSTLVQFYRDGSLQSSNTNQSDNRDIPTAEMTVFGQTFYRWSNNTFSHGYETPAPPMLYYSCGLSMTAAQVGALHTAMQAFQTALGRQA